MLHVNRQFIKTLLECLICHIEFTIPLMTGNQVSLQFGAVVRSAAEGLERWLIS